MRMTPAHFDELVAAVTPHLPLPARGPRPINPTYRIFAVLFWLSQGGRQRVIALAVDIAESTCSKHYAPVIDAILPALAKRKWPTAGERIRIGDDLAHMTGGNGTGWSGLYVFERSVGLRDRAECAPRAATLMLPSCQLNVISMLLLACPSCNIFICLCVCAAMVVDAGPWMDASPPL